MRIGHSLHLEQSQKLTMTPELRQAIAILQLSALELTTYVDQQLLENPLLEVMEEPREKGEDLSDSGKEEKEERSGEGKDEGPWEMDWEEYFQNQEERISREYEPDNPQTKGKEPFLSVVPTLQEHLLEQLRLQPQAGPLALAEYIIGNLDDNGYLRANLEDIAKEKKVSPAAAAEALAMVQRLDPTGVGARNLEECLRLQLPLIPECPPEMEDLLVHLEDIAAGKLQKIANQLKITVNRVQELADLLRKLEPKPGRYYASPGETRYIVPDVVIEEIEGEYIILVNDVSVPRLSVNQTYRKALCQNEDSEARKFVEQKINAAAWLIRSIEQRRMTLYKVAQAIVGRQKDFLRHGLQHLKPLTLKDIADEVGVHESTVSRATANKYVQTPRGIFEFKYFFASGIGNEQGQTTEAIKQALKEVIDKEDAKNPLSDQKITEILKGKGIAISRRTAAKYRDEMGIPSTTVRRRY